MNKLKYVVIHRRDENNVGDMASQPLQYFLSPDEYAVVDITKLDSAELPADVPVIIGGGGLINNEFFGSNLQLLLMSPDYSQLMSLWKKRWQLQDDKYHSHHQKFTKEFKTLVKNYIDIVKTDRSPRIIWGAGSNQQTDRKVKTLSYPDWMAEFDLVGVRDWKQNLPWVPCASCMHPAFDRSYEIKNEVIWFEHKKQLIKDFGDDPIPRFVNSGNNMDQTIEILGSAETILTNSYHGAYWGALLGRKVIVVNTWSTKFLGFRHPPAFMADGANWRDQSVNTYPQALEDCRSATKQFWNDIQCM